ncbi:hypothetical protein P175DRAFT_0260135 [Aspergillus ochraceoroseus IBT 24754]|uniref:ADP-ribosylation factor n=2 Tax=Aspergillus ochraceoroseus TaxID=138278 RepID=A0A2T5LUD4_9EURO|nr:uncharacterized protein P175DRAFT_0260135 [Aspergillus ochraceoroseus IBT 24754]KKK16187.1 hypothetical protein AOCH_006320 [Aspergillus ochraceoroseus]PTU19901.1 hypothetical protein P175DRAFT_0260135 [Aspergillus ochraceoroseus IBT 24754]
MFKGLSKWLFGSTEYQILLIGNDASGKTTLLYRLKFGETVTTIPTIGFNVETVEYPRGWKWTFWDIGAGCNKIRHLLRHYITPNTLVIFLHDCDDPFRQEFPDWMGVFLDDMIKREGKYLWILFNKQDTLPPDDDGEFIGNVRKMYEDEMSRYKKDICYKILDHKLSAKTGEGLNELLVELHNTMSTSELNSRRQLKSVSNPNVHQDALSREQLKSLIEKEGREDTIDAQAFWISFLEADLSAWDHRSHLKAGYIIAVESAGKGESIFTTADTFIAHLKRLKEMQPDKFRNTEHRTMTIFWLVQLQLAIWNYKLDKQLDQFPSRDDFQEVLLHTPSLRDTKLWSIYYTKDRLFSREAREVWTAPDLQPFPVLQPSPAPDASAPGTQEDPERLLRFGFAVTQHIMASDLRRGQVIKEALASLQATTIRLRAKDARIPPYSETQAYFWIQIAHAALRSLENGDNPSESMMEKASPVLPPAQLSFSNFTLLFDITPETWKKYYSGKVWESIAARREFVPPDLKPLPNLIGVSSEAYEKGVM